MGTQKVIGVLCKYHKHFDNYIREQKQIDSSIKYVRINKPRDLVGGDFDKVIAGFLYYEIPEINEIMDYLEIRKIELAFE